MVNHRNRFTMEDKRLLANFLADYAEADRTRPSTFAAFMEEHPNTDHTQSSWHDHYRKTGNRDINIIIRRILKRRKREKNEQKRLAPIELDSDSSRAPVAGPSHSNKKPRTSQQQPRKSAHAQEEELQTEEDEPVRAASRSASRPSARRASAVPDAVAGASRRTSGATPTPAKPRRQSNGHPSARESATKKLPQSSASCSNATVPSSEPDNASMRDESAEEAPAEETPRKRVPFTASDFYALVILRSKRLKNGKPLHEMYDKLAERVNKDGFRTHSASSWQSFERDHMPHVKEAVEIYGRKKKLDGVIEYRDRLGLFPVKDAPTPRKEVKPIPRSAAKSAEKANANGKAVDKGKGKEKETDSPLKMKKRQAWERSSSYASDEDALLFANDEQAQSPAPPAHDEYNSRQRTTSAAASSPRRKRSVKFTAEDDDTLAAFRAEAEFKSADLGKVWAHLEAEHPHHSAEQWEERYLAERKRIKKLADEKFEQLEEEAARQAEEADDEDAVDEDEEDEEAEAEENAQVLTQLKPAPKAQPMKSKSKSKPNSTPQRAPSGTQPIQLVTSEDSDSDQAREPQQDVLAGVGAELNGVFDDEMDDEEAEEEAVEETAEVETEVVPAFDEDEAEEEEEVAEQPIEVETELAGVVDEEEEEEEFDEIEDEEEAEEGERMAVDDEDDQLKPGLVNGDSLRALGSHTIVQPATQLTNGHSSLMAQPDNSPPTPPRSGSHLPATPPLESDDRRMHRALYGQTSNAPTSEVKQEEEDEIDQQEDVFAGYEQYAWPELTVQETAMFEELEQTIIDLRDVYGGPQESEEAEEEEREFEVEESQMAVDYEAEEEEEEEEEFVEQEVGDEREDSRADVVEETEVIELSDDDPAEAAQVDEPQQAVPFSTARRSAVPPTSTLKRPREASSSATPSASAAKRPRVKSAKSVAAEELMANLKAIRKKHDLTYPQVKSLYHCLSAPPDRFDLLDAGCVWFAKGGAVRPRPDSKAYIELERTMDRFCWSPEADRLVFEGTEEDHGEIAQRKGRKSVAARKKFLAERGITTAEQVEHGWPFED